MKVIVTGGSGRVAKAVIHSLANRGHEVLNLDRRPAERPAKFIYTDLRRREMLQPIMESADAIIHMGEIPNVGVGHYAEEEVFATNCTVGSLVLQLASELKYKRVIYTSTIQVYGFLDRGCVPPASLPIDENHPLRPQNAYSLGKVAVENYARICGSNKGLSVAAFRLPWVLTHDINDEWFEWTDRQTELDEPLGIYIKDSDVGECFAACIENPRPGFEVYNIAAREVISGQPIREAIQRKHPDYPRLPDTWGKYQMPYLWDKAKEHFAWEPKWNYLDKFREKFGRDPKGVATIA